MNKNEKTKSNAVYKAVKAVAADIKQLPSYDVPMHLRNAPTQLMKEMDFGDDYRYAHDEAGAFAPGENYFPEELQEREYYFPTERGLEAKIKEKLTHFQELNRKSSRQRYKDQ